MLHKIAGNVPNSVFRLPTLLHHRQPEIFAKPISNEALFNDKPLPLHFGFQAAYCVTQHNKQPETPPAHQSFTRWLKMLRLPFSNCNEAVSPKRNAKPIAKISITASCNERDTIGE